MQINMNLSDIKLIDFHIQLFKISLTTNLEQQTVKTTTLTNYNFEWTPADSFWGTCQVVHILFINMTSII